MKILQRVILIGIISWCLSWAILVWALDRWVYLGLMFYGLGLSLVTAYLTILLNRVLEREEKE